jgi:hypothetical protein
MVSYTTSIVTNHESPSIGSVIPSYATIVVMYCSMYLGFLRPTHLPALVLLVGDCCGSSFHASSSHTVSSGLSSCSLSSPSGAPSGAPPSGEDNASEAPSAMVLSSVGWRGKWTEVGTPWGAMGGCQFGVWRWDGRGSVWAMIVVN